jgi:hypothetical protein
MVKHQSPPGTWNRAAPKAEKVRKQAPVQARREAKVMATMDGKPLTRYLVHQAVPTATTAKPVVVKPGQLARETAALPVAMMSWRVR